MMEDYSDFLLVNKKVLPEVFTKFIRANELIQRGKAKSVSEAVTAVGISRSVFYKYKGNVFSFRENSKAKKVTLSANLDDKPGVLSNVLNEFAKNEANILTINQTIPLNNIANLTITAETGGKIEILMENIKKISGVESLKIIAWE